MEPLKEMFNRDFYKRLAAAFSKVDRNFNSQKFFNDVTHNLEALELNGRMRNTSLVLNKHLPASFKKSVQILKQVIPSMNPGYTNLLFPDYVGLYGHDHFDVSMDALEYFTRFGSSEFAIREFLKKEFHRTLDVMQVWSKSKDHHVRRLASEGSRPRLPWSFKLDEVIKNPEVTRPILENLKTDESLYVKKSVANHLNDLSKDSPSYMLNVVKSWDHKNLHTSWIVKRACRSLIKKGDAVSLSIFSFEKNVKVQVNNLTISKPKLRRSESFDFHFTIISKKVSPQKIVVDYVIRYVKKGGATSPKVFKLKELDLQPGQTVHIRKQQHFKDLTTRKHYPGIHTLEVMINGRMLANKKFTLL
jgi:3-methyladenine DNA glycosylase AlkC